MTSRICGILLLVLIASSSLVAQTPGTPPVEWTREFGSTRAYSVAVDENSVYVTGCFLTKLNKDGSEAWYIGPLCTSSSLQQRWRSVTTDGAAFYLAGSLYWPSRWARTAKYDATTNSLLWIASIKPSNDPIGMAEGDVVAVDQSGVYVGGRVIPTIMGDTSGANVGQFDAFVRKYDLDASPGTIAGVPLWTRQFGSLYNDSVNGIAVDATGVYVVGEAQGPFGEATTDGINAFVRKYDKDGNELWTHAFADASAQAVAVDATGIYVAGSMCNDVGCWSGFVRKYDTSGNELWTRQSVTYANTYGNAVAVDETGVYIAGDTQGAFPGYTNAGGANNYDGFARKYDSEGNLIWTYQFGTGADDWAYGIAADDDAAYVAAAVGGSGLLIKLINAQMVPTLTLPGDQTAEATGPSGAAVTFPASATDLQGASVDVTCDPASGSTFPPGTTTVNCWATDVHNNKRQGSFTVTVVDTTPPNLTVPANISTTATVAGGAYVTYSASATDLVDGSFVASCVPAPGSLFAPGTTTVTCSATDQHGNTATPGNFTVSVTFAWSGYLQPVNADSTSTFKVGSTVPIKFQVSNNGATITNLVAMIYIAQVSNSIAGTELEAVSTSAADVGNIFRYDATAGQYIFNWGTKSLVAGTYQIRLDLGDGVIRTVLVSLKK